MSWDKNELSQTAAALYSSQLIRLGILIRGSDRIRPAFDLQLKMTPVSSSTLL